MPVSDPTTAPTAARPLLRAAILAIGSELTTGETRDTNSSDLARSLSAEGVDVAWMWALPDRLETVTGALRRALEEADLTVTTGGLGPTPDDLTREAIAQTLGQKPEVDPTCERWLRDLFERRGIAFPQANVKQAWLIPSAQAIPNDRGTAPGWWVEVPRGRVIVALPGPPSEMLSMWEDVVLPRLRERGLGREQLVVTFRLVGIGESAVAALLGEQLLRAANPVVATYAKPDGVDVRISATAEGGRDPQEIAAPAREAVLAAVGGHVWGLDGDTWPKVLGDKLAPRGWTVALAERGTDGATRQLLGDAPWLIVADPEATAGDAETRPEATPVARLAVDVAHSAGASIGLAVRAAVAGHDTAVQIAAWGPWGVRRSRQTAFLAGSEGRRRAAVAAAAFLNRVLTRHGQAPAGKSAPVRHPEGRTRRPLLADNRPDGAGPDH
jgi:nicotinamide-nucleotide amidase